MKARLYGISVDDLKLLVEKANGKCVICGEVATELHVDHCHKTNVVRGLLCRLCNLGLGYFKDDPERLSAAISYLTNSSQSVYLMDQAQGMA